MRTFPKNLQTNCLVEYEKNIHFYTNNIQQCLLLFSFFFVMEKRDQSLIKPTIFLKGFCSCLSMSEIKWELTQEIETRKLNKLKFFFFIHICNWLVASNCRLRFLSPRTHRILPKRINSQTLSYSLNFVIRELN
jgi:hypothetical protein